MVKRSKKDLSKRMTLRRKFSIQRHVRNHQRDMRRAAKRLSDSGVRHTSASRYGAEKSVLRLSNKDTSKKEFLIRTLEARHSQVAVKKEYKKKLKKEYDPEVIARRDALARAEEKRRLLQKAKKDAEDNDFYLQLEKCMKYSDFLLLVLDARCPLACYSTFLCSAARSHEKPHWCILTKGDLVPPEVLEAWITYFRAHTEASEVLAANPTAFVAKVQERFGLEQKVRITIAGLPNVGIQTFCTALVEAQGGRVSVHPSKELSATRAHVPYSNQVTVLTLPPEESIRRAPILGPEVVFRSWKYLVNNLTDLELHAEQVLQAFTAHTVARHYRMAIPESCTKDDGLQSDAAAQPLVAKKNSTELLVSLQKRRTLKDVREAARIVLVDFNQGKLPWCCLPPRTTTNGKKASSAKGAASGDDSSVLVRSPWTVLDNASLNSLDYGIATSS